MTRYRSFGVRAVATNGRDGDENPGCRMFHKHDEKTPPLSSGGCRKATVLHVLLCSATTPRSNDWDSAVTMVGPVVVLVGTISEFNGNVNLTCFVRDTAVMVGRYRKTMALCFVLTRSVTKHHNTRDGSSNGRDGNGGGRRCRVYHAR